MEALLKLFAALIPPVLKTGERTVVKVYLKDGNIYGKLNNATFQDIQLTHESSDDSPVLIKRKYFWNPVRIAFFRKFNTGKGNCFKVMLLNCKTFEEEVLMDQKPERDGLEGSFQLHKPRGMQISPEKTYLLLIMESHATSDALIQIDLRTKEIKKVCSAESFEFIPKGEFKGALLLSVSDIRRNSGRAIFFQVSDRNGHMLHEFEDYDEYRRFRSLVMN